MASLLRLQPSETPEERQGTSRDAIAVQSIFSSASPSTVTSPKEKSRASLEGIVTKHRLQAKEAKATASLGKLGIRIKGNKAKKEEEDAEVKGEAASSSKEETSEVKESPVPSTSTGLLGLGDYGSSSGDSD